MLLAFQLMQDYPDSIKNVPERLFSEPKYMSCIRKSVNSFKQLSVLRSVTSILNSERNNQRQTLPREDDTQIEGTNPAHEAKH